MSLGAVGAGTGRVFPTSIIGIVFLRNRRLLWASAIIPLFCSGMVAAPGTRCPCQRCYCSICRKSAGGGYAINIMGVSASLQRHGRRAIRMRHAVIDGKARPSGISAVLAARRWVSDRHWPELIDPFASAIETPLPATPATIHIRLRGRHKRRNPWID